MKTRMILLIGVTALLGACSQAKDGPTNQDTNPPGIGGQVIEGQWKGGCRDGSGGDYQSSGQNVTSFTQSAIIVTGNSFNSNDCTGEMVSSMEMNFTFSIPSRSTLGADIFNFDAALKNITMEVFDQDMANMLNTMAYCGFTDWMVGVKKDITEKDCITGANPNVPVYSIIKITDTQMQLGEPDGAYDGTTPELRHRQLSDETFSKPE